MTGEKEVTRAKKKKKHDIYNSNAMISSSDSDTKG